MFRKRRINIKKILSIMVVICMMAPLLPNVSLSVNAATATDFEYTDNGDGTVYIKNYKGTDAVITIPETIDGKTVTKINSNAFEAKDITSVSIPNTVTSIDGRAFINCKKLETVSIPNSVTSIGDAAFNGCINLKTITLLSNLTELGGSVFEGCSSLTGITLPSTLEKLGTQAFKECNSMQSITIPSTVKEMGDGVFTHCDKLETANIPANLTVMGGDCFSNCPELSNVTIENGAKLLGGNTFYNCPKITNVSLPNSIEKIGGQGFYGSGITSINIPASLTTINDYALYCCPKLTTITVDAGNVAFSSSDGILYNKDKTVLIQYPCGKADTEFMIPDGVVAIGKGAFGSPLYLTKVTIPSTVNSIQDYGFDTWSDIVSPTVLSKVYFNGAAPSVGIDIFIDSNISVYCKSTYRSSFSTGDTWNGRPLYEWKDASGMTVAVTAKTTPESGKVMMSVTPGAADANHKVYYRVVSSNPSAPNVGDTITISGWTEVTGTTAKEVSAANGNYIEAVEITTADSKVTKWGKSVQTADGYVAPAIATDYEYRDNGDGTVSIIRYTGTDTVITIPEVSPAGKTVTKIESRVFKSKTITSVSIPNTVTSIGEQAFLDCTNLETVSMSSNLVEIGSSAFENCSSLPGITLPSTLKKLDTQAFRNCDGLQSITIPSTVKEMGYAVFGFCNKLETANIPAGLTIMDMNCFSDCPELSNVTIENGAKLLGGYTFNNCPKITNVSLPNSIEKIGAFEFYCSGITSLNIPASITTIDDFALYGCPKLTTITVDAGNAAFSSSDGILYNKDKTVLIQYPCGKADTEFIIPDGVVTIGVGAMGALLYLTKLTIPSTVNSIRDWGFFADTSVVSPAIPTKIYFKGTAPTVGSDVFFDSNISLYCKSTYRSSFSIGDTWNGRPLYEWKDTASGMIVNVAAKATPTSGKVMLTVTPGAADANHKVYYRVVNTNPSAPNVGDTITISGWTEVTGTTAKEVSVTNGNYIEAVEITTEDNKITKWGKSAQTADGYVAPVAASGMTVTVAAKATPEAGKVMLTVTPGAADANHKVYYRVVSSNPSAPNVGDTITISGWTEVTGTTAKEVSAANGNYIEVVEINTADSKITKWGKSAQTADGYVAPVAASGMTVTVAAKATPEAGKVMLTVTPGAADANHKVYYRVVSSAPTAPNVGDTITISGWTEVTGTTAKEVSAANGNYIEVVEITTADNKITKWGKSAQTADGYVAPVAASGMTVTVTAKATPEAGKVMLTVTPGAADANHKVYYRVVSSNPSAPNVGDTITISGWTEVTGTTVKEVSAANGNYIEVVEITTADSKITKWGKSAQTADGYVAPVAADGMTVNVASKTTPESGKVMLTVTPVATDANHKVYYRVVSTDPTAPNVGDTITISGWTEVTGTTTKEISAANGNYIEAIEITTADSKITKWGKSAQTADGYVAPVAASGMTVNVAAKTTPESGKVMLSVTPGATDANHKVYYKVVSSNPTEPNVGDTITISGWTEVTGTTAKEVSVVNGNYIEAVEITTADSKITKWGKSAQTADGYVAPVAASGMTVNVAAKTTPESGKVMLTVTPVATDANHKVYYRVVSTDPTAPNVGDTITISGWTEVTGTTTKEISAANGNYIEAIEITTADSKITKWGKSAQTADGYVAPVAASGMTVNVAAKTTPESGKVMLSVTPGATDANHKVYYKVVSTAPTNPNVGDPIAISEWTEVTGTTAKEVSVANGNYIEAVEITTADSKITKWGKSAQTADGYVAPVAADGMTVNVAAKTTPESGKVMLTVTPGATDANHKVYYKVVSSNPTAPNVGDTITISGWTEVTGTTAKEVSAVNGSYIEVVEINTADSKITKWGKSAQTADGYVAPVAASGMTVTVTAKATPEAGKVMLTVTPGAADANHKVYYRVVNTNPSAPNVGDTITISGWTEVTGTTAKEVSAVNGNYIEVVEITLADSKITKWGKSAQTADGYVAPVAASGMTVNVAAKTTPESGKVMLSVTPGAADANHKVYYRVVSSNPSAPNVGDTITTSGWTEVTGTTAKEVSAANGNYIEAVEITLADSKITKWGKSAQTADGYVAPVAASGMTITVAAKATPTSGKVMLSVTPGASDANHKVYYKVVSANPSAPNVGDPITISEWTEVTGTTAKEVSVANGNYIEVVEITTADSKITKWGKSAQTADGYVAPVAASGMTVNVAAKAAPESGKVMLSVTPGAEGANHKVYYRLVSSAPTAPNVGDTITISGWTEVTGTTAKEVSAANGNYIEVVEITTADNKITKWGKSAQTADGYVAPVAASGMTVTVAAKATPESGKVMLSVTPSAADANHKVYYKVVSSNPSAPNVGDTITTSGWTEVTGTSAKEVSVTNGNYIEVVEITLADSKITKWGKSAQTADGYVAPVAASGMTVNVAAKATPTSGKVMLTVTPDATDANHKVYYKVVSTDPTAPNVGDTITISGWTEVTGTSAKEVSVTNGNYIEVVEITLADSKITKWGKSTQTADGYVAPVAASGMTVTVTSKTTPESGKVMLSVTPGAADANHKVYYRVVSTNPSAPNVGDTITISGWTEVTGTTAKEVSATNGNYIEVVEITTADSKITKWGKSAQTADGYVAPVAASGMTVNVAAKATPTSGKVMLSVTPGAADANHKVYYRVVSSNPSAPNVGDTITISGWTEVTGTTAKEVSAANGNYIEVVEITTADNKITKWGKSAQTADGYVAPVAASGMTVNVTAKATPEAGKVMLTVTPGAADANHKVYYRVVSSNPSAPNVGDTITTSGWTEVTGTSAKEISVTNGNYIEVVEITKADSKITKWGKSAQTADGYVAPVAASGMTVNVAAKATPASGKVMLSVTPGATDANHKVYYKVVSTDPIAHNVGDTITISGWTEVTGTSAKEVSVTNGNYIEVVEITKADSKITKWGKSVQTADGYVAPVAASGMTVAVNAKATPESGKVMLTVTPGAADASHKVYYKVVSSNPTAPNVGDTITISGWTEVTGTTAKEVSVANGNYIEVVEITKADSKITKWGKSAQTADGYVPPVAASGMTVTVTAKATPESGKVMLTVTPGATDANHKVYYKVVSSNPTAPNVGDPITISEWTEATGTSAKEVSAANGNYIEAVEITTADSKLTKWGKSVQTADGYATPVTAGGITISITPKSIPEANKFVLAATSSAITLNTTLYYRETKVNPDAMNVDNSINTKDWILLTDANGMEITASNGNYIEVVEITTVDNKVTKWGKSGIINDGYNEPPLPTIPVAPANPIQDDQNNTFGWTLVSGYSELTDYEYSLNSGLTWTTVSANPLTLPNQAYAAGAVQVRLKADPASNRASGLICSSTAAYTVNSSGTGNNSGGGNGGNTVTPPTETPSTGGTTRKVNVVAGEVTNNSGSCQVEIVRTAENNKTVDSVVLDDNKTDEVLVKAAEQKQDKVTIIVDEIPDDKADEVSVHLSNNSIAKLADHDTMLQIKTEEVTILLPKETVQALSKQEDLYFRVVPIVDEKDKKETITNAIQASIVTDSVNNNGVAFFGTPMTIETNYQNQVTKVTFSLKDVTIPTDPDKRQEFLSQLAIFIEHSDGEKVLDRGTIKYDSEGNPVGIEITLTKFSTFTMVGVGNVAPVVKNVKLSVSAKVGKKITATYTYSDADNDLQGKPIVRWYRADSVDGKNKKVIKGANKLTYTITNKDKGKYIIFEIIPKSKTGVTKGNKQTVSTKTAIKKVKKKVKKKDKKKDKKKEKKKVK